MEKKIPLRGYIVCMCIMLVGALILGYPSFSSWWADHVQRDIATNYTKQMISADSAMLEAEIQKAEYYNERLAETGAILTDPFDFDVKTVLGGEYLDMLAVTDVMATIEIPSIALNLPIYHGTSEQTLEKGIGHLASTSLPVGGKTSNCVLTGHTGLPNKTLFTNIDQLKSGDYVILHTLNHTYTYEVQDSEVIEPEDLQKIIMEDGLDQLTLITCTPYGVNSHRLLVHCLRVFPENLKGEEQERFAQKMQVQAPLTTVQIAELVAASFALVLFLWILIRIVRVIHHNRKVQKQETLADDFKAL